MYTVDLGLGIDSVAVLVAVVWEWVGSSALAELSSPPHVSVLNPQLKEAAAGWGTVFS